MNPAPINILLIEDSATDALLLSAHLKTVVEFSFELKHVNSLELASIALRGNNFEAVLLDLSLPDSMGIDTFLRLRKEFKSLPIVIVTGNDDRDVLNEALQQGADNYLLKDSCDGNRIAIAILSAIRNHTRTRSS